MPLEIEIQIRKNPRTVDFLAGPEVDRNYFCGRGEGRELAVVSLNAYTVSVLSPLSEIQECRIGSHTDRFSASCGGLLLGMIRTAYATECYTTYLSAHDAAALPR